MDSTDASKPTVYMTYYLEKYVHLVKKKRVGVNVFVLEKTGNDIHERVDALTKMLSQEELDTPPRYTLTKTQGQTNAPNITEYVIAQIIARERFLFDASYSQKEREWKQMDYVKTRDISSLTIGILGVGSIGKRVAEAWKLFGMTVWGYTRTPPAVGYPHVDVYRTEGGLVDLLHNCDYVCNILPSTKQTRGLLSGDVLINCKHKKSVFINVGRGDVVDDESLVNALRSGWLSGAILDVVEKEPLSKSSALWEQPGVTITPHISGWSLTGEYCEKMVDHFIVNYNRYIKGESLQGEVDWIHGY